ncbi:MAG: ethylbenzene dehydrogenase-related protein [Sulfuricella sp.]
MNKTVITASALGLVLASMAGTALAAPDWSKVPSRQVTVFHPGTSGIEWIMKGTEHGGAKGLSKGERCTGCHEDEKSLKIDIAADKIVKGEKLEPKPLSGHPGTIPVSVQAANDGANLYLRFSWKEPKGGGEQMDKDNPVKLAVMLEDNKVVAKDSKGKDVLIGAAGGCWGTCHTDARTMPGADDKKTKYVVGGSLANGQYYDLMQWKSGKGAKPVDGYVADKRVMEGGKALVSAEGKKDGDTWTVTFTRKLAGGAPGDITLASGKTYNMGFAIHNDHTAGRFHHVSFGYSLGIDTKADITAAK